MKYHSIISSVDADTQTAKKTISSMILIQQPCYPQ